MLSSQPGTTQRISILASYYIRRIVCGEQWAYFVKIKLRLRRPPPRQLQRRLNPFITDHRSRRWLFLPPISSDMYMADLPTAKAHPSFYRHRSLGMYSVPVPGSSAPSSFTALSRPVNWALLSCFVAIHRSIGFPQAPWTQYSPLHHPTPHASSPSAPYSSFLGASSHILRLVQPANPPSAESLPPTAPPSTLIREFSLTESLAHLTNVSWVFPRLRSVVSMAHTPSILNAGLLLI